MDTNISKKQLNIIVQVEKRKLKRTFSLKKDLRTCLRNTNEHNNNNFEK